MDFIPLTKEQEDACLKEIGSSREQLKEDVETLREWVKNQHHLPPSRLKESDYFYIHYITGCKGSIEKAKRKIDAYYSFRSSGCSFYENNEPLDKQVVEAKQYYDVALLPKPLPDGTRVTLFRVSADPENYDYTMCCKLNMQMFEMCLRLEEISPATCYAVFDLKNVTSEHLIKVNPGAVRDLLHIIKEVLPFRVIKAIGLNCNPYISYTINTLVKPFLPKKLSQRPLIDESRSPLRLTAEEFLVQCPAVVRGRSLVTPFHRFFIERCLQQFHLTSAGFDELLNFLPKDVLPNDMGGDEDSLHAICERWYKVAEEKREWFTTDLMEKTDESKRLVETWDNNSFFGVEGSIKKLCVD